MPPLLTRKRRSIALKLFVWFLGTTVIAWGLQAKLSLYKISSGSHPVSVAKLIQPEQANKKSCTIATGTHAGALSLPIYSAIVAFRAPLAISRNRQVDNLVPSAFPFYPHDLLFRPPPFQA